MELQKYRSKTVEKITRNEQKGKIIMLQQDIIDRTCKLCEVLDPKDMATLWHFNKKRTMAKLCHTMKDDNYFMSNIDVIAEDLNMSCEDVKDSVAILDYFDFIDCKIATESNDILVSINLDRVFEYIAMVISSITQTQDIDNTITSDNKC